MYITSVIKKDFIHLILRVFQFIERAIILNTILPHILGPKGVLDGPLKMM